MNYYHSMVVKSVGLVLDDPENMKSVALKYQLFEIWSICSKNYDQTASIESRVLQNIKEEHLAEYMAEFLSIAYLQYEQSDLLERVLRFYFLQMP